MPTYDYVCDACGHAFELFQSITADPEKTCPACGKRKLRRLIGIGAAILVGGSGGDARDSESSERAASDSSGSKTEEASASGDSTSPSTADAAADPPEKKISGSTSTPTHEAREGRGVGNLVDAARRQRKTDQKQKTGGGDAAKAAKSPKKSGTRKKPTSKKTASRPKSAKPASSRKKK